MPFFTSSILDLNPYFEKINANQAWSLFFTGGQEDKVLGQQPELGRFFTYLLIALGVTGTLWATYFNNSV
ncbi:hypothetical protein [Nostoc sp.]|uniref:hypothetical protein n=1 Tax=Nostoc sp. TaxID=1180 RepID=UPI002FFB2FFF